MARSGQERSMPLVFEVRNGGKSKYFLYKQVLENRTCGRRVIRQAMEELDAWRKKYGRLFESLEFADWREFVALLDRLRGDRPPRSAAHSRARRDSQYAQETFYEAMAKIDDWQRRYGYLFTRLKHTEGCRIAEAVGAICNPNGHDKIYVWNADQ